jgi:putative tryptophan/tyrosine transport system substrate-binding protein
MLDLRRRQFITLLGGAAMAWPLAARAQQPAMQVVGFLNPGLPERSSFLVAAFREGLKEASYIEGQNVTIEYRWAQGHYDQLQTLVADLVRRRVAVIAATGGSVSAQAAKAATATIPIVFNVGEDPTRLGLVASFNRPGGNITGVNTLSPALESKRLGLLRELVPQAAIIAVLFNPTNPDADLQRRDIQAAAAAIGQDVRILNASNESDIHTAFAALVQQRANALIVGTR